MNQMSDVAEVVERFGELTLDWDGSWEARFKPLVDGCGKQAVLDAINEHCRGDNWTFDKLQVTAMRKAFNRARSQTQGAPAPPRHYQPVPTPGGVTESFRAPVRTWLPEMLQLISAYKRQGDALAYIDALEAHDRKHGVLTEERQAYHNTSRAVVGRHRQRRNHKGIAIQDVLNVL